MYLHDLKWPDIAALSRDVPVVVPIASLEQHGRHLPLGSAGMITSEIVRRAEKQMPKSILVLPLLWLGHAQAHADFPGTISASPRLYVDLLAGLVENLIAQGFRRVMIFNGSTGNDPHARQTVADTKDKYRDRRNLLVLHANYDDLAVRPWDTVQSISPKTVRGHACEWQTSMIMRIAPDQVGDVGQIEAVPLKPSLGPSLQGLNMRDHSEDGHIGDPRHASAVKGEVLIQAYTSEAVGLLEQLLHWRPAA